MSVRLAELAAGILLLTAGGLIYPRTRYVAGTLFLAYAVAVVICSWVWLVAIGLGARG